MPFMVMMRVLTCVDGDVLNSFTCGKIRGKIRAASLQTGLTLATSTLQPLVTFLYTLAAYGVL